MRRLRVPRRRSFPFYSELGGSPPGPSCPVCLGAVVWMPLTIGCQGYLWATGDRILHFVRCSLTPSSSSRSGCRSCHTWGCSGWQSVSSWRRSLMRRCSDGAVRRQTGVSAARAVGVPILVWVIATAVAWVCAETARPLIVRTIVSAGVAFVLFLTLLLPTHREQLREIAGHVSPVIRGGLRRRSATSASPATT